MNEDNQNLPAAAGSRPPCKCAIVGPRQLDELVVKYLGGAKENITRTEVEILLFALYNESNERGGIAKTGTELMNSRLRRQRIVLPQGSPAGEPPQAKEKRNA